MLSRTVFCMDEFELKCEPELMYDHINENGKTIKKLQEANN